MTTIIAGLIALAALVLFLFIGRRVLHLAIKVTIAGVIVLLLLVAATVGWWRGWFSNPWSEQSTRPASQPHRTNSKRRAS